MNRKIRKRCSAQAGWALRSRRTQNTKLTVVVKSAAAVLSIPDPAH